MVRLSPSLYSSWMLAPRLQVHHGRQCFSPVRPSQEHRLWPATDLLTRSGLRWQGRRCFSGTGSTFNMDADETSGQDGAKAAGCAFKTIRVTRPADGGDRVAHLELNRPKVKNAFGLESAAEFCLALDELENDSQIRCIILSGNGPDLTSGVDLKSFMTVYGQLQETEDVGRRARLLRNIIQQFQAPFKRMHSFGKPIICIQHGLCFGLGIELAACSDIRYCSRDTKMAIREVLIGIAADVGSLQKMPKLVANQSLLNELIFTGRNLEVKEAVELGFVSRVFDSKQAALRGALETAQRIAQNSPVAVQGSKQNLTFSRDQSFQIGLDYNAIWNSSMMQSEDVTKAISAILSKSTEVDYENY